MTLKFIDLFAGLGGFHLALRELRLECVFASEKDKKLRELYRINFPESAGYIYGDIHESKDEIPKHDVLCAGFPCQPFSKSGSQLGVLDKTRGTLFQQILDVLRRHQPEYVILENVGNFERHDNGQTWKVVRESLEYLGYTVRGTEHISSGGSGLLSPHHFGHPHRRERFFIVARLGVLPPNPFPVAIDSIEPSLQTIIQPPAELTEQDIVETKLSKQHIECIEHWNRFLSFLPEDVPLPSFPIWADEIDAEYPYELCTPYSAYNETVNSMLNKTPADHDLTYESTLGHLPSYARTRVDKFPRWKIRFIAQNRKWFTEYRKYIPDEWVSKLSSFPPSLRKLEWNCKGEERDLWKYVLQFRPSGLRAKRYITSPSLVAMTTTQIPILGPERRFITRREGLRLQGFPTNHTLPASHNAAFRALGNAVHVDVVSKVADKLFSS